METIPNSSGWKCQGEPGSSEMGEDQILPMFLNFPFISLHRAAVMDRSEYLSPGIPKEKKMSILILSFSAMEIVRIKSSFEYLKVLLRCLTRSLPDSGEMAMIEPSRIKVSANSRRKGSEGSEKDSK